MPTTNEPISTAFGVDPDQQHNPEVMSPRLPPELECQIFLLALKSHGKGLANLLCVGQRVQDWLIPVIYDVISFDYTHSLDPIITAIERYGCHVHQVMFLRSLDSDRQSQVFDRCPNIWNLVYWCGGSIDRSVYRLTRLTQLSVDYTESLKLDSEFSLTEPQPGPSRTAGITVKTPTALEPSSTWFSNITRLVVSDIQNIESAKTLLRFPNLSHFMLVSSSPVDILKYILRVHPKIKVVVWLLMNLTNDGEVFVVGSKLDALTTDDWLSDAPNVDDERVVTLDGRFSDAWVRGAKGEVEQDMWKLAERKVEERKTRR